MSSRASSTNPPPPALSSTHAGLRWPSIECTVDSTGVDMCPFPVGKLSARFHCSSSLPRLEPTLPPTSDLKLTWLPLATSVIVLSSWLVSTTPPSSPPCCSIYGTLPAPPSSSGSAHRLCPPLAATPSLVIPRQSPPHPTLLWYSATVFITSDKIHPQAARHQPPQA
ncbi:hypothetical protein FB45DRAFT_1046614 [Roridomyces roridus]|uniref:Uncharacterized protein n=1 Tax=Roridomyces roridus TaxID=1738132 RepID=A0AAD7F8D9_9AGAR|nr:hypothetical protein FB45DRAFT_1046614 [Roridomyces roridus]